MKRIKLVFLIFLTISVVKMQSCGEAGPDLLYINGKIHTMDEINSIVEAVAVREGKVIAVGSTSQLRLDYSGTTEIDLNGKTVLPGFNDAEGSIVEYSKNLNLLNFALDSNINDILFKVRQKADESPEESWIAGFGWNEFAIPVEQLERIDKTLLDNISTVHNIYLVSLSGDAVWVNSKLIETLNITTDTPSPAGGEIELGEDGEPTGLLFDAAVNIVRDNLPELTPDQIRDFIKNGTKMLLQYGITQVQDRTVSLGAINVFKELIDSNLMPVRIYAVLTADDPAFEEYIEKGIEQNYKDKLTVRSVSLDYDGGFEFQRAIMSREYLNPPKTADVYNGPGEIENVMKRALDKNFQVRIKAVGDKAVSDVLDVVQRVRVYKDYTDPRTVIEHVEFTNDADLLKINDLNVIPSVRPDIAISDIQILEEKIEPGFLSNIALWKSLMNSAGAMISGTDFPFHHINPFIQIYYLVTGKEVNNPDISIPNPDQVLTLEEAIRTFTSWSAYACFQEESSGSIEVGKFADMIVLSDDIFADTESLLRVKVEKTIVNGEVIFKLVQ